MDKKEIIRIIHNASSSEALEAWSAACREYESNPSSERDLLEIHTACVDKIMKIVNDLEHPGDK